MNKKIAIGVVLVLVIILAVIFTGKKDQTADLAINDDTNNQGSLEKTNGGGEQWSGVGSGTFVDLMARGENLECTVSYAGDENGEEVSGSLFVSKDRFRGDFETKDGIASMISRGDDVFVWSTVEGEKYGMTFNRQEMANSNMPDVREPVPEDSPVDYNCQPWTKSDDSIFEPPRDIIFNDFSQIMKAGMEDGMIYGEESGVDCSVCEAVPDADGQRQCREALSC